MRSKTLNNQLVIIISLDYLFHRAELPIPPNEFSYIENQRFK